MKEIPDGSIDMILCDPPFGTTQNKWDSVIPLDELWKGYHRIIKQNGAIVLFSQMPFTATLINSNLKEFRYEWIWQKEAGTGFLNCNRMPLKIHENICVFYKKLPTYNPQMRTGFSAYSIKQGSHSSNYGDYTQPITISDGKRYPIDIIMFNRDHGLHPTQKPVALCEYFINTYTNPGETVLDTCMGSGTTGIACKNTGRYFIGYELDKDYFQIAEKRIRGN